MASASSQARGWIDAGAAAASLHHSPWQRQIPNLLSKARDQTHILMDPSPVCNLWATKGTPDDSISGEGFG